MLSRLLSWSPLSRKLLNNRGDNSNFARMPSPKGNSNHYLGKKCIQRITGQQDLAGSLCSVHRSNHRWMSDETGNFNMVTSRIWGCLQNNIPEPSQQLQDDDVNNLHHNTMMSLNTDTWKSQLSQNTKLACTAKLWYWTSHTFESWWGDGAGLEPNHSFNHSFRC